jgi:hypothetical protein
MGPEDIFPEKVVDQIVAVVEDIHTTDQAEQAAASG